MSGDNNKDPLFTNKLAAAVLTAALLIFGLPQLTKALTGAGGHHGGGHEELHLAYGGDIALETTGRGEEEAPADLGTLLAAASADGGARKAALCKSCHTFEEGGANGTGPNLWNIVGKEVASVAGFNYSSALQEFGGTWTYERLDAFIRKSQELVPGGAMNQNLGKDTQRADIIAYMATLSPNPVPFPEPVVVEAEVPDEVEIETAEEILEDAVNDTTEAVVDAAEDGADAVSDAAEEIVNGGEE